MYRSVLTPLAEVLGNNHLRVVSGEFEREAEDRVITRVLVGYTATKAGRDALALATRIAVTTGARLDVVVVLPGEGRSVITPPDAAYSRYVRDQAETWLAEAIETVPAEVSCMTYLRAADSVGEGLVAAADEFDASVVVVGAANGAPRRRHRIGTTANDLLHLSHVPVFLAPRGFRKREGAGIPRVTVGVGTHSDAEVLLVAAAAAFAGETGARVRLVSLVTTNYAADFDTGLIRVTETTPDDEIVQRVRGRLEVEGEVLVAQGNTVMEAVQELTWLPGEIFFVGSSRLARPGQVFLGAEGGRLLRALRVPVAVLPRPDSDQG